MQLTMQLVKAIESGTDLFALFDKQGYITYANPAFQPLLDVGSKENNIQQVFPSLDLKHILSAGAWHGVVRYNTLSISMEIIAHTSGEQTVCSLIGHDVSDIKRSEEELKQAKEIAEQSARVKQEFLANMSHEIRTPLNAIIGFAGLLLNSKLSEEQERYIQLIKNSGDSLLGIVNDVLDFSKIESGKLGLENIDFGVEEVIQAVISELTPLAIDKGLQLNFFIDPSVPPQLIGDPLRLKQILMNLVNNAIKFTRQGAVDIKVSSRNKVKSLHMIEFNVKDTGIGIEQSKLDMIFESFTQANTETTRKFGGTGLGLTIVKKLAELHEGRIKVDSVLGEGTTFTCIIPYKEGKGSKTTSKQNNTIDSAISGYHVLMAEDNDANQILGQKLLESFGCEVTVVGNGKQAIDKASEKFYDVILMDIQMPEMDGIQATEALRNDKKCTTPIVAMTAHALSKQIDECLRVGMNEHVAKPIDPKLLHDKIKKVTRTSNMSKVLAIADGDLAVVKDFNSKIIASLPENIKNLTNAVQANKLPEAAALAHKIRSGVSYVANPEVMALLDQIEYENLNAEKLQQINDRLIRLLNRLAIELKESL